MTSMFTLHASAGPRPAPSGIGPDLPGAGQGPARGIPDVTPGTDNRPMVPDPALDPRGRVDTMAMTKDEFFRQPLYMLHVTGWPAEPAAVAYQTGTFSLVNSGNRTLRAPKRSWKVDLEPDGGAERLAGMTTVNLKAMYNDPSQLREALAWRLFSRAGVPASRHTYAKLGLNATYMGLFSVIEQVDKRYLKDRFGDNDEGNLYKAACGQLGCATLERRVGPDGHDDGRQYIAGHRDDQTYRLMTNRDDPAANTYEDLARLIRVVDGAGLDGDEARFEGTAFRQSVEDVLNVRAFLRWAGVNVLIGSWDNYFATPSNYFLYNSGRRGDERGFMASPYFTFIPWDYDNSFGIDFFDTRWQDTDLVDWAANTGNYGRRNSGGRRSRIPLVQHLLRNRDLLRYYLDHVEFLLDTEVNPDAVAAVIGAGGGGLWGRVARSAYLESARVAVHRPAVHQPRGLPQRLPPGGAAARRGESRGDRPLRAHAPRPCPGPAGRPAPR